MGNPLAVLEPKPHSRKAMAIQQVETALALFYEGRDFYSVITLAGAADEILGQMLRSLGKEPKLDSIKRATAAIYEYMHGGAIDPRFVPERANLARNALKHWHPDQPDVVWFNAEVEARDMLSRAVSNFWSLDHQLTAAMDRFIRDRHSEMFTAMPRTKSAPGFDEESGA